MSDVSIESDSALVLLHGPIIASTGSLFQQQMLAVIARRPKRITILIASEGGMNDWGNVMIDTIQMARSLGIEVVGMAHFAYSMAAFLLQTCSVRYLSENGTMMVHGASSIVEGDYLDHETHSKMLDGYRKKYSSLLAERTNKPERHWQTVLKTNKETFYSPAEALKVGLIDEVIAPLMPPLGSMGERSS